ncbi:MAG TPA: hypothetical protein VKM72_01890 [Thermoanaerobaculia bacterium]|nr:hypothetical protein [Thermoanaerobaculia bacterium]
MRDLRVVDVDPPLLRGAFGQRLRGGDAGQRRCEHDRDDVLDLDRLRRAQEGGERQEERGGQQPLRRLRHGWQGQASLHRLHR